MQCNEVTATANASIPVVPLPSISPDRLIILCPESINLLW